MPESRVTGHCAGCGADLDASGSLSGDLAEVIRGWDESHVSHVRQFYLSGTRGPELEALRREFMTVRTLAEVEAIDA